MRFYPWHMPDNIDAQCYAKTIAESDRMQQNYPEGFEHHYFYPQRLKEPLGQKTPSRIFMDSMSDFCGGWVKLEEQVCVCEITKQAHWHTFQSLTKAPHRVHLAPWSSNTWVGVSSPPDMMAGHDVTPERKRSYLETTARNLSIVKAQGNKVWMSLEPVSYDVELDLERVGLFDILDWVVIGAASRGRVIAQPRPVWIEKLVARCAIHDIPVFMKSNLDVTDRRVEFPVLRTVLTLEQVVLPLLTR